MTPFTNTAHRGALVVAAAAAVVAGAGSAQAAPASTVAYTPTFTATPGFLCGAYIGTTKVPGARPQDFRVRMTVTRIGVNCGTFKVSVDWRNTTTKASGGEVYTVYPNGSVSTADENGVLDGFGLGGGPGTIESDVHTYRQYDEAGIVALPHVPGHATFSLGG